MTARRTVGSKASADRPGRDKAALERWAKERLRAAREGVAAAIRQHFAAGRSIVFEKSGKLYVQAGPRAKPRLVNNQDGLAQHPSPGFAESERPKYIKASRKKTTRTKSR